MMEFRPAKLRRGVGNGNPADGLCLMQMVDWFSGSDYVTDHPQCASPVLCKVGIELNDLATPRQREMLWPLVWRLIDSNDVPEVEQKRCEYLVREITHRLVVPVLDHIGHHINTVMESWCLDQVDVAKKMLFSASALRTAESLQDIEIAARIVSGINHGFLQVSFLTDTTATAARTVMAMPAFPGLRCEHHYSDSYRREPVIEFMVRAMGVSKQFSVKRKTWSIMRDIFEETIMLGRHGEQDPVAYEPRARQLEKLLTPA